MKSTLPAKGEDPIAASLDDEKILEAYRAANQELGEEVIEAHREKFSSVIWPFHIRRYGSNTHYSGKGRKP